MNAPNRNCRFCVTKSSHQADARRPPRFGKHGLGGPPGKRILRGLLVQKEGFARRDRHLRKHKSIFFIDKIVFTPANARSSIAVRKFGERTWRFASGIS
jgi:hypothetical protein